jgi:serine/threonine protein kinase
VTIAVQVCKGLSVAHARGIIHRDLKPENVFLDDSGSGELTSVLCDFGLAKICDDAGELAATGLTATGAFLGTPYYMSPEQILDAKRVDQRTDVWSLGMILYHALAGRPALAHIRSFPELLLALSKRQFRSLSEVAPWVPRDLARVVALTFDPFETRCGSVDAVAQALRVAYPPLARLHATDLVRYLP